MKIGILTHYQVCNHGAILQMYGLYNTLKTLGHIPYILTYKKNSDFEDKKNQKKTILLRIKKALNKISCESFFYKEKDKMLDIFLEENFKFLPLYPNQRELDAVCIGSDEVWSLECGINIMMYSHTITAPLVFAYAPTFGQTDIERIKKYNCYEIIKSGLEKINCVSARDFASQQIVKEMTNKDIPVLCDPVFLYGFKKEQNISCNKIPKEKYLVVYAYNNRLDDETEYLPVKQYAKENNLKIVSPGYYHHWTDKNINVSPIEFLNLFKNAQAVVTDCFHGCVLSVLTNRPFACFIRKSNTNKLSFLLKQFNMLQAKLDNWNNLKNVLSQKFNWSEINLLIEKERQNASRYLHEVLDDNFSCKL